MKCQHNVVIWCGMEIQYQDLFRRCHSEFIVSRFLTHILYFILSKPNVYTVKHLRCISPSFQWRMTYCFKHMTFFKLHTDLFAWLKHWTTFFVYIRHHLKIKHWNCSFKSLTYVQYFPVLWVVWVGMRILNFHPTIQCTSLYLKMSIYW